VATDPRTNGGLHGTSFFKLACPSYYADFTYPLSSPYQGVCAVPGTKPLWSYLAYSTIEPNANTSVDFTFQTADMVGTMCPDPAAMPTSYTTMSPDVFASTNVLQPSPGVVCSINGGSSTVVCLQASDCVSGNCDATGHCACPVDLVQKYNGGSINGPMLADCMNLTVALNPDGTHTNTPTVTSFELRYSCPSVN